MRTAVLGLRLDYEVAGDYTSGVLFHGGLYSPARSAAMPWGTGLPADQVVALDSLSDFQLSPADHAPLGWSGRVLMTFMLQNAGAHTRAKILVRSSG